MRTARSSCWSALSFFCLHVPLACCLIREGRWAQSRSVVVIFSTADQQLSPQCVCRAWHSLVGLAYSLLGWLTGWSLWREITYVMESGSDSGHVSMVLFLQGREGKVGGGALNLHIITIVLRQCMLGKTILRSSSGLNHYHFPIPLVFILNDSS